MTIKPGEIAIVGAAETTKLGAIPDMAQIMLHADAALNNVVVPMKEISAIVARIESCHP